MLHSVSLTTADPHFLEAVRDGLTRPGQKKIPPEFFYDEVGSALFDAITLLPEYGLTRADRRLLQNSAEAIAARLPGRVSVIELGSGSGTKTAHVLRAITRRQRPLDYIPIDLSGAALERCAAELSPLAAVRPVRAGFVDGLRSAMSMTGSGNRVLLLFSGSTIGNFDPEHALLLLRDIRRSIHRGDLFLIGADLVKPAEQLLLAYDDPTGVTAAFNLNLLGRINRELGGNFDLRRFRHFARYDPLAKRMEMHLSSREPQNVYIAAAGRTVHFETGETIWTESSYKYEIVDLEQMAVAGGFRIVETWTDQEWPFVESLWEAA